MAEENLNEVIENGKKDSFQFFVRINESGELKSLTLPIEKKNSYENRFAGEIPLLVEYNDWLANEK